MRQPRFRKTVVDRLNTPEPEIERVELIPLRIEILFCLQIVLLIAVLLWSFFGSIPVVVNGEALYVTNGESSGSFSIYFDEPTSVPIGTTVKLIARDGSQLRFVGKIVRSSVEGEVLASARFDEKSRSVKAGTRFKAVAIIGERAPITWITAGLQGKSN